ncbi:hypothetical protein K1719_018821 [Acacia pycnantha]|nr:hypothetical protein K1719_018821 [Acacia pycnantha]
MWSIVGVMGGLGYTASKHAIVGLTKNTTLETKKKKKKQVYMNSGLLLEEEVEKMEEEFVRGLVNLKGIVLKAKDIADVAIYLTSM